MSTRGGDFETIRVTRESMGVLVITLDRPKVRNALSRIMKTELALAIAAANTDRGLGAVVLTGADPAFCAGADIRDLSPERGAAYRRTLRDLQIGLIENIVASEKLFVAAVNGSAIGGGLSLAAACDIVIASERAVFRATQVHTLGVAADLGLACALPNLIGLARSRALLHLGFALDAETARSWGLVLEVVEHDTLLARALALAQTITAGAPLAQATTKKLLNQSFLPALRASLDAEAAEQSLLRLTPDHAEGAAAFREGRSPKFTGTPDA